MVATMAPRSALVVCTVTLTVTGVLAAERPEPAESVAT